MGASESSLSSSQQMIDEITTVTERSEALDPVLGEAQIPQDYKAILTSPLKEEGSLTDILVRKASSSSAPAMKTFHSIYQKVEIGELKGRLTEVISNCDALCKRIDTEGPESLRSSFKPFATAAVDSEIRSSSSSVLKPNQPSNEAKSD
ncbi:E3 ubiquitin-protein ligase [Salix suchowensis]|nr:E3 ubiquitin-protein ligase [Salix suchowensis]